MAIRQGTRRPGYHGAAHHPVPRRGRTARRPDRDPPRGPHHRARHPRRAQAAPPAGHGRIRRAAAHPRRRLPRRRRHRIGEGTAMNQHLLSDTAVLTRRSLRHIARSPDTIITTTIMPIAFMLLFVYVFGGAINSGSASYVDYLLPGILLMTIASGISYTAF